MRAYVTLKALNLAVRRGGTAILISLKEALMKERYRIMARVPKGNGEPPEIIKGKTAPNKVYFCDDPDLQWYKDNVPCRNACPAQTRIPEYIDAAARGDYEKSYEINLRDNVLPHVLGRVCAHPCEEACRHGFDGMG
jgi:hypothetical protein